jgi:glutaconyl-CoA/methylmalonyl-CoA decarboxylase subunit gamma
MNKRATLTINDKNYEVEVEDLNASPVRIKVNDTWYEVKIESAEEKPDLGPIVPSKASPVPASVAPKARPAAPAPATPGEKVISAPMPGTIMDISVAPGDALALHQEVCKLEAMKMKNSIKSPFAGTIKSVNVAEGQKVAYGQALITLE